jgi:hypothetical protein
MIRKRPRGETSLSKATYDRKLSKFGQPSPGRLAADEALTAAQCAQDRAREKEINAAGGFASWILARMGHPQKPKPIIIRRV